MDALPGPVVPVWEGVYEGSPNHIRWRADSVMNSITSFGTARDKAMSTVPNITRAALSDVQLEALYETNAYAQRIVDDMPEQATRKGWEVTYGDEVDDDTRTAVDDDADRLCVRSKVREADTAARLYRGAVIWPVLDEGAVSLEEAADYLRTPLDLTRVRSIRVLHVFDRRELHIEIMDTDITSEGYGTPLTYQIRPLLGGRSYFVHRSRLVVLPGAPLPASTTRRDWSLGASVLDAAWDAIRGKTTSDQAGEILTSEVKQDVLKIAGTAGLSTSDQAALFELRISEIARGKSALNMITLAEGDEFDTRHTPLTGWADLDDRQAQRLASAARMPITRLMGQSPSGLSTDDQSGRASWEDEVASYQEERLRPVVEALYTLIFSQREGPTAGAEPQGWDLRFRPLSQPTAKEIADTRLVQAQSDHLRLEDGVLSVEHVARARFGGRQYGEEIEHVDVDEWLAEAEARRVANEQAMAEALAAQQAAAEGDGEETPTPPTRPQPGQPAPGE